MTFSFIHSFLIFSWCFYSSRPYPLNWGNWWRQNLSGDAHTSLTTDTSALGAPRPATSLSSVSLGLTRGLLLVGHLKQVPKLPQLTAFNAKEQWLYSKLLLSDWASHPISQAQPSHPEEETHFSHLYPALFSPWTQTKASPSHRAWLESPCSVWWWWAWLSLLGTTNLGDINTHVFFIFHGELMNHPYGSLPRTCLSPVLA